MWIGESPVYAVAIYLIVRSETHNRRFITTPLLLLDILLTAGMPWHVIVWTIFLDLVMIVMGLVGALTKTVYKWGKRASKHFPPVPHSSSPTSQPTRQNS